MKFGIFILPSFPGGSAARDELRPIGRNRDAYQGLVEETRRVAIAADRAGFDVMMMSEHHFHSEGLEASVNPLLLIADLLARTERIALAPLGMVIPTWDPVRLAENIAVIDHLAKGRFYLGVARGYQSRWVQTFSQVFGNTPPATSDNSAGDLANQDAFSEVLKIMKMCWSQETVRYHSELLNYSIPSPHDGITWPAANGWTDTWGSPGELDENNKVRAVSVIPRPYQDPHPPLWQPFAVTHQTLTRCAREEIMPWIFQPRPDLYRSAAEAYQQAAADAGRDLELGEDAGTLRIMTIAETQEAADAMGNNYVLPAWQKYFSRFGHGEVLRLPEDEEKYAGKMLPDNEFTYDRMKKVTLALSGTVDDIKREIQRIVEIGNPEWFGWFLAPQQGWQPIEEIERQIELFGKHVIPEFRDSGWTGKNGQRAGAATA